MNIHQKIVAREEMKSVTFSHGNVKQWFKAEMEVPQKQTDAGQWEITHELWI